MQQVRDAPVLSLVLAGGDLLQEICHALPLGALEAEGLEERQNLRAAAMRVTHAFACAGVAVFECCCNSLA